MPDIFAGFDILGLGTLLGSLLFLGALVWLLVDNRSFDEVNRRHAAAVDRTAPTVTAEEVEVRARSPRTADARSAQPPHPRRVA